MESAELNQNGDYVEDLSAETLLSIDSSDTCGVFEEPELLPRVGDEYQVEIPALITGDEYDSYLKSPIDAENNDHVPYDFWLGLSVPVTWIDNTNKVTENMKDEKQDFSSHSTDAFNKNAPLISESVRETIDPYQGSCYYLVPGVCGNSWYDIEEVSFLLGLYIFEKKFALLKRFIGSKKMGDILLFYYGKFYKSIEYSRWSNRTVRSRKCVYGRRLFIGLRQQELLSRLLPPVSEECQKALTEVSKTFADGGMSLIEYVSYVKAMVGLKTLVDAVAIGKGKQDLTGVVFQPVRSNQASRIRPEIPIGKACSSLTRAEIVKFLTGGYRLSKARSSDLFWEAVWPRLLARGWHSEQPRNQAYIPGAKHSLVFLTPGVKNFSRERLVKGNHYFDSVTDVLSKVGSEPELLELDTEKVEGMKKEENGWIEKQENLPEKRHCYLQPRTPSRDMDVMKFTVVDTSLGNGKTFEFKELQTQPMDVSKMNFFSKDSDQGTSEVSTNDSDCANNMLVDQETNSTTHVKILSDREKVFDRKLFDSSSSNQLVQNNGPDYIKPVKNVEQENKLYGDMQTRKPVISHLSQKLKRTDLDSLHSVTKRHRTITACSNEEISSSWSTFPLVSRREYVHGFWSDSRNPNEKALSQVGSSQDKLSFTSSPKGSPTHSTGGAQDDVCHGPENYQSHMLIDLNMPQEPVDFENGVFITASRNLQEDITSKQQDDFCEPKTSADISVSEQPANMNSRRQSTRNRPPTARALEALVNGYLTATRRRKKGSDAHETSRSRPPRCSHVEVAATGLTTNDAVIAGESGTGVIEGGNINMFDKLQVLSNGNGTQISNP